MAIPRRIRRRERAARRHLSATCWLLGRSGKECLRRLIRLHSRFPPCYSEGAMNCHHPSFRLCRSPKLTPARQVWRYRWKALGGVKRNPASAGSSGSSENNLRSPIWIRVNAKGRALELVFGRRRLSPGSFRGAFLGAPTVHGQSKRNRPRGYPLKKPGLSP